MKKLDQGKSTEKDSGKKPGHRTIVFEARGVPGAIVGVVFAIVLLLLFVVAMVLGIVTLTLFLWVVLAIVLLSAAVAAGRQIIGSLKGSHGRKR